MEGCKYICCLEKLTSNSYKTIEKNSKESFVYHYPQDDSENFFQEYTEAIMTQPKINTLINVNPDSAAIER